MVVVMLILRCGAAPDTARYVLLIGKQSCGSGGIFNHARYCGVNTVMRRCCRIRAIVSRRKRTSISQGGTPCLQRLSATFILNL